jgi:hypothetical protein
MSALYLSASAISFILGFLLAEGLTRLILPFSTVEYRVDPHVGQILVANQRTRWVHQDYDQTVMTNSEGFHDREHQTEKPSDVYRVLVLGDSFIEALSAPIELGFTQQLEYLLQREVRSHRVEVMNLAVGGMGPAQHLRMLEVKGTAYRPDLVIMSVFPDNDFWDSYEPLSGTPGKVFYQFQSDDSLNYVPADSSWLTVKARPWLRKSAFLTFLRRRIDAASLESWLGHVGLLVAPREGDRSIRWGEWGVFLADHPQPWPDAYRTTLQCIKSAHDLAVKAGAEFTVMLIGSVASVEDRWQEALTPYPEAKSLGWNFEAPYTAITQLGAQAGFGVINLAQLFREDFLATKKSRSWPNDGHWNPSGHQLAAQLVTRDLVTHRMQYSHIR